VKFPTWKGKEKEAKDRDFEEERAWLLLKGASVTGTSVADPSALPEEEGDLECGCCFSHAPFVRFLRSRHSEPSNNSFTVQHDPMHGGPPILQGMCCRLRFQPPRRAQLQDCLHGPIRVQVTIP